VKFLLNMADTTSDKAQSHTEQQIRQDTPENRCSHNWNVLIAFDDKHNE
jgi:hypothetical protein